MGSVIQVAGVRFLSKDGDIVEGVAYATTTGFEDKKSNGHNVVVYRDIGTHFTRVRPAHNFHAHYTPCGHPDTEVRGSMEYCTKCDQCFGVD
jgi:hypothetical protein